MSYINLGIILILGYFLILPIAPRAFAQYYPPSGFFQSASCTNFTGWTCDRNDYNQSLTVDIYRDGQVGAGGVYVGSVVASSNNSGGTAFCGSNPNHGFIFSSIPDSLRTATAHNIYAYAHDFPSGLIGPLMNGSPRAITCSQTIKGSVFSDVNLNQIYDAGVDSFVPIVAGGGSVFSSPAGSVSYPAGAQFQLSNLPAGVYTIYLNIPSNYEPYYPNNNGTQPFFTVQVGESCSTDTSHGSTCDTSGNISTLRFALRAIYMINGNVYIDYNRNGIYDSSNGDAAYPNGTTVTLNAGNPKITGVLGGYTYTGIYAGTYTVATAVPSGYVATSPNPASQSVTVGPTATGINFGIVPQYTINGTVYIDLDGSTTFNAGDRVYPYGATMSLTGVEYYTNNGINTSAATNLSGVYTFFPIYQGSYQVSLPNLLPRYEPATSSTVNIDINSPPPRTITRNIGLNPLYQISGSVFNDTNKNGTRQGGENTMGGSYKIDIVGPGVNTTTTTNTGTFVFQQLHEGTYTISLDTTTTPAPAGYRMTGPKNGPPPSFTVTVGRSCSVVGATGATCDLVPSFPFTTYDVGNLNFGMTNYIPWFQTIGNDTRIDNGIINDGSNNSGFTDIIPDPAASPQLCGSSNLYASVAGGGSATAGVLYSDGNIDLGPLGAAAASSNQWVVDNTTYASTADRTSYSYITATLRQSGITPSDLALNNRCGAGGINDCTLDANLPSGIYISNSDLNLRGYTFTGNRNYVILVNGNLKINGEIHVNVGSTALFSVSGNITVDKTIGTGDSSVVANLCAQTTQLDGIYSADGSFIIDGTNDCSVGVDQRVNIGGSIITNASGASGGKIDNRRDLCANDRNAPAFALVTRADLMLYIPEFIKYKSDAWREVAP
jgi:hypothetical protein